MLAGGTAFVDPFTNFVNAAVVVGDTLLLEGAPEDIQRLAADMDLVDVARPREKAFRRGHAPVAIAALIALANDSGDGATLDR